MAASRPQIRPAAGPPAERQTLLWHWPWPLLAGIVAVAAWLRFRGIGTASLSHFDEGVYVISAIDAWQRGPWEFQLPLPYQAPPLFPWLIALAFGLTQMSIPAMGAAVSAVMATATIPLIFLLGRRIAGTPFGLVAATLLALSDLHVAFSRMALTDAPLTFWFVLALYGTDRLADAVGRRCTGKSGADQPPRWAWVGWILAVGLATGAAWNTKYNGWMPIAIAMTTAAILLIRGELTRRGPKWLAVRAPSQSSIDSLTPRGWMLTLAGLAAAGMIAGIAYLPWYRYVEAEFPGGYAAVVANHRTYVGGLDGWLPRAGRLLRSLPAFRHLGWQIALAALVLAAGYALMLAMRRGGRPKSRRQQAAVAGATLAGGLVILLAGLDGALVLLALAGILPAVLWGDRRAVLLAVWVGSFAVLVPFYHPYMRLLVPAWPGVICLALLVLRDAFRGQWGPGRSGPQEALSPAAGIGSAPAGAVSTGVAIAAGIVLALAASPFGIVPSTGMWSGWTAQHSYQAWGDAVGRETPEQSLILCQTLPTAWLYCPRPFVPVEGQPWVEQLAGVPPDIPCYLAVDFHGLYSPDPERGRRAFSQHLHRLEPVAVVPNDLRLTTLLDYLPPQQVALHVQRHDARLTLNDRHGRAVVVPPPLDQPFENIIVLYRVHRRQRE